MAWLALAMTLWAGCTGREKSRLPILGEKRVEHGDTIYHTISDFRFIDQDSVTVTPATFSGKVYVADFFFTSCPTICPVITRQMLRVYEATKGLHNFAILSHTIDPERDSVARLHDFAEQLGVSSSRWRFVTGAQEDIHHIAQGSYFVTAMDDASQPGGFLHGGSFLLIDKERRIRGVYDGTQAAEVDRLIADISNLLAEDE